MVISCNYEETIFHVAFKCQICFMHMQACISGHLILELQGINPFDLKCGHKM